MSNDDAQRSHGVVVTANLDKAYFFIHSDNHNALRDLYCPLSALGDNLHSLNRGERVTYLVVEGKNGAGPRASNVKLEKEVVHEIEVPPDRSDKRNMR
jgi:cold shock CspA family protein